MVLLRWFVRKKMASQLPRFETEAWVTRKWPINLHNKTEGRNFGRRTKTVVIGKLKENLC